MPATVETPSTEAQPPPAGKLRETAKDWLQQRGVPHFLGEPQELEHRRLHAAFSLLLPALIAALMFGWVAGVVALAVVLGVLVWTAVSRSGTGLDSLPPPGRMNVAAVVALMFAAAVDAAVEWELRWETGLVLGAGVVCSLLIAAATPLGALRIFWWAVGHPLREWRQTLMVLAGALPLLLLTLGFLFMTTELWDVATNIGIPKLVGTLALFGLLGLAFLLALAKTRLTEAQTFSSWADVKACLHEQPPASSDAGEALQGLVDDCLRRAASFEQWAQVQEWLKERSTERPEDAHEGYGALDKLLDRLGVSEKWRSWLFKRQRQTRTDLRDLRNADWRNLDLAEPPKIPELKWRERWNITLVVIFGQGLQVLAVSLMMAGFFLLFGWLTVNKETLKDWEVRPVQEGLWEWSGQHLKVTALLAAFAGLTYAVSATLFKEPRQVFLRQLDHKVRQRLAVRALYRALPADAAADEKQTSAGKKTSAGKQTSARNQTSAAK